MCGICGRYNFRDPEPVSLDLLKKMAGIMAYRGPDDEGYHLDGPLGLGMRRLSIIDVAGGRQPIANEDGSILVVCNGEIYNFPELRAELEGRGHRFATLTDVETIVHLYEDDGEAAVRRLGGMFAFALWDRRKKTLLLGRDRLGKKPLFYAEVDGRLIFGSAIKSILLNPEVGREVDPASLHNYLTYQYVPEPATIFRRIRKLPPAHYLVCDGGGVRVERYWDLSFAAKARIPRREAAVEVRSALEEATRARLMSEVPLGAFLSGGLDSTIVVGLMSRLMSRPVQTFSIGFEDPRFNELGFARIAANHFHTDHHEFVVKPDAIEVLPDLIWHFEEPMADSSGIPTFYVARMTRQLVTVALNGDGGDEAFAGYERYLAFFLSNYYHWIPRALRESAILPLVERLPESSHRRSFTRRLKRFARAAAQTDVNRYGQYMTIFDRRMKDDIYSESMRRAVGGIDSLDYLREAFRRSDAAGALDRLLYADTVTYLPGDLLVKMDRMCMAHSLEGRSPFLDHKVMELAARLPENMKLRGSSTKSILKSAMADLLPGEILRRGKMGFGVPLGAWFRNELRPLSERVLLESRTLERGYFRAEGIRSLLDEHGTGRGDHSSRIWALLVLELWHRTFIDRSDWSEPWRDF